MWKLKRFGRSYEVVEDEVVDDEVDEDEAVQVVQQVRIRQQVQIIQIILEINRHEVEQILLQELKMSNQHHEQK